MAIWRWVFLFGDWLIDLWGWVCLFGDWLINLWGWVCLFGDWLINLWIEVCPFGNWLINLWGLVCLFGDWLINLWLGSACLVIGWLIYGDGSACLVIGWQTCWDGYSCLVIGWLIYWYGSACLVISYFWQSLLNSVGNCTGRDMLNKFQRCSLDVKLKLLKAFCTPISSPPSRWQVVQIASRHPKTWQIFNKLRKYSNMLIGSSSFDQLANSALRWQMFCTIVTTW